MVERTLFICPWHGEFVVCNLCGMGVCQNAGGRDANWIEHVEFYHTGTQNRWDPDRTWETPNSECPTCYHKYGAYTLEGS